MYTIGRQLKPLAANWILFLIAWQHNSHQERWITNDSCLAFAIIIFNWVSVKRDESLLFNEEQNSDAYTEILDRTDLVLSKKIYLQDSERKGLYWDLNYELFECKDYKEMKSNWLVKESWASTRLVLWTSSLPILSHV